MRSVLPSRIVSGGQSGADRAGLDVAIAHSIPYGGWCPRGGWAEDYPQPPGLLADYPALHETPSRRPVQRTEWNVRDSTATLVLLRDGIARSAGTTLTRQIAETLGRPLLVVRVDDQPDATRRWLEANLKGGVLNVAGPRRSNAPGLYDAARMFLERVLFDAHSRSG